MSDTRFVKVTLKIDGELDHSNPSPREHIYVSVRNNDGINWEEAVRELTSKVVDWANSFIKYPGTEEIIIRPGK